MRAMKNSSPLSFSCSHNRLRFGFNGTAPSDAVLAVDATTSDVSSDTVTPHTTEPPKEDTSVQDSQVNDAGADVSSRWIVGGRQCSGCIEPDAPAPIELPDEKPPIDKTYETFIGDWEMKPGKEVTKCTLKRLENVDPIYVTGIKTKLAKGSHHLIVYKSEETEEQPVPFDCIPFTEGLIGGTFPMIISQIPEEHLEFPNGIAMKLEPNQMIRIEAHFLNYFPEKITAHADVTFETIKKEDMVAEANMLFYGTPDFTVKANAITQTTLAPIDPVGEYKRVRPHWTYPCAGDKR